MATQELIISQSGLLVEVPAGNRNERRRSKWLERRNQYIGGSEAFELLNQSQYGKGCARALGLRKLGIEPDFPEEIDDALLERGNLLEPLVAAMYEEQTGRKVRRPAMDADGMPKPKLHKDYPWAGVNADRLILAGSGGVTETGILELKTRGEGPYLRIKRLGPFPGDILQTHWGMWVAGYNWGSLATLGVYGGLPLAHFDVKADPEIQELFKRQGSEFVESVWGRGEAPPPPFAADDQRCRVCTYRLQCRGEEIDRAEAAALREIAKSKSNKDLIQISNAELSHTLAGMDILKRERKAVEEALEIEQDKVITMMGERTEAALVHGYGKVYRMDNKYNGIDAQRIKSELPEVYEQYYVSRRTGGFHLRTYPTTKDKTA